MAKARPNFGTFGATPNTPSRKTRSQQLQSATGATSRMEKRRQPDYQLSSSNSKRRKRSIENSSELSKSRPNSGKDFVRSTADLEYENDGHTATREEKISSLPRFTAASLPLLEKQNGELERATQPRITRDAASCSDPKTLPELNAETAFPGDEEDRESREPQPPKSLQSEHLRYSRLSPNNQEPLGPHSVHGNRSHAVVDQGQDVCTNRQSWKTTTRMYENDRILKQISPVMKTIAHQILLTCNEMCSDDTVENTNSGNSLRYQSSLSALKSLLNHAISLTNGSGSFLCESPTKNDQQLDDTLIWQVNVAAALCILLEPRPEYNDLDELHTRFLDLFCGGKTELQEWEMELLLDLKTELWTSGVREKRFLEADGLNEIFVVKRNDTRFKQIQLRSSEKLVSLQNGFARRHMRPLALPQQRKKFLKEFVRVVLSVGDKSRAGLNEQSNNEGEPIFLTADKFPASETDLIHDGPTQIDARESTVARKNDLVKESGEKNDREKGLISTVQVTFGESSEDSVTDLNSAPPENPGSTGTRASPSEENDAEYFSPNHGKAFHNPNYRVGQIVLSSMQEQYEKAKLAASEKAAAKNRGIPLQPSQRRPWSTEEENALMTGLDRVQGPYWSQILAMYGHRGSISEVLKDRNQVQLKDKARNLKLFFLKSGHEVPHYLKSVTGELKTRAPAQAAKPLGDNMALFSDNQRSGASMAVDITKDRDRRNEVLQRASSEPQEAPNSSTSNVPTTGQDYRNDDHRGHRKEDEEDLSNAIQLALRAIQERNGMLQAEEDDRGKVGEKGELVR